MLEQVAKNLLPFLKTRREYFDYLDRWTVGTVDDLQAHMTTRALVKGYLLETSRFGDDRDALMAFKGAGQQVTQVDDTFYRLTWPQEHQGWALMEMEDQRYPVIYTALEADLANWRIEHLVSNSAHLDRGWFAAPMFRRMWDVVQQAFPDHRFSRLVFEHESVYEAFSDDMGTGDSEDTEDRSDSFAADDALEVERRRARMQITERIGRLAKALSRMREEYEPLESIICLRVPASRRGGHDVYFDGRFTNRSDSVTSLRQTIQMVKNIYRHSTEKAEEASWPQSLDMLAGHRPLSLGAPVLIKFSQELEESTFERWIAALRRKNNRFRLWGNPIEAGRGKVHIYAVDNHLWQPIDLEITRNHVYALLPTGTCGNTIHRLVTNIQRFVDPKLETFIGDEKFESFIARAPLSHLGGAS